MARLMSLEVELEAVTPLWIGGARGRRSYGRRRSAAACGTGSGRWRAVCWAGSCRIRRRSRPLWRHVSPFRGRSSVRVASGRISVVDENEELPGLAYMFWSVFQQQRDAILPGERFRLRLNPRP